MSIINTIISLMGYSGLYFFLCLQVELACAFFVMLLVSWKNQQQQYSERILNSVNFSDNSWQQHSSNLYSEFILKENPKLFKQFVG